MAFDINTVLHTKDGRVIGNAIVIGHDGEYNVIKTDYGNELKMTDNEVQEGFYIAFEDFDEEEMSLMREALGNHKHAVKTEYLNDGILRHNTNKQP